VRGRRYTGKGFPGLALLQQAGFKDAELVAETGYNSSPKTRGVLVRARKPAISDRRKKLEIKKETYERWNYFAMVLIE
jgi:hypothetical protein